MDQPRPKYLHDHLVNLSEATLKPIDICAFRQSRMYITTDMTIPVFAAIDLDHRIIRYVKSENNATLGLSERGEKLIDAQEDCPFLWLIENDEITYNMPMTTSFMASTLTALHEFNLVNKAALVNEYIMMALDEKYDFFPDPE